MNFAQKILNAKLGVTHIFSVGQAGFIVKSVTGNLLGIDLYLSDAVERVEGSSDFKRLLPKILAPDDLEFSVVICTHPHADHFDMDAVSYFLANGKTQMYCSTDCGKLNEQLNFLYHMKQIHYISACDKVKTDDFVVSFTPCDHGKSAPDAVGVLVEVDNKVIYEAGDTALRLDWESKLPQKADVMIAPINGRFGNMNPEECAALAETLKPKLTIPCHYGMFAANYGNVGEFCKIMKGKNLPYLVMAYGEDYVLK